MHFRKGNPREPPARPGSVGVREMYRLQNPPWEGVSVERASTQGLRKPPDAQQGDWCRHCSPKASQSLTVEEARLPQGKGRNTDSHGNATPQSPSSSCPQNCLAKNSK